MINPFSHEERLEAMMVVCFGAVSEHFSHISVEHIINPPHRWFDAALARQVALHMMISVFDVPKRRVVEMQGRSREAVNRCLRTIDDRRLCPVFNQQYENMADRAKALLAQQFALAA